jgi:hypothetical protein
VENIPEPVELIDADLDEVAGGFIPANLGSLILNFFHSFNGHGSGLGNGEGNFTGNLTAFSANGNGNGIGNGNILVS